MHINFDNDALWVVHPFGIEVWITETLFNTWILMAFLIGAALVIRYLFFKNLKEIPEGFQNVVEAVIEAMDNFAGGAMGRDKPWPWLDSWFFGVMCFMIASDLSGLFNLRPPTTDISMCLAFSVCTFFLVQVLGFIASPKKYIHELMEPFPLFLPLNIIGELSMVLSLAFRVFGNILAGIILLELYYHLMPRIATIAIPVTLHFYLDIFAGILQAYIFCMLSMSFIKRKISEEE